MFALAGFTNITEKLTQAQKGSDNHFQNFLDNVAEKTTKHFQDTWKEYKDIVFELRLNGTNIIPAIRENNRFNFSQRSDGFKRFVTFLLLISVEVQNDHLNDTLILIDEPEIGLHPKGAKYLRDELIKISKKNEVVYSTHSIFMIDTVNIKRHYLVKKKNEITTIETASESNVVDEEVLLNALGFSIFEFLKEKNLIIEGWYDKKLFHTYLASQPIAIRDKFNDVGICHARGANHIGSITPMLELAKRQCLIVSDNDNAGKLQQKRYKEIKGYGEWLTYAGIDTRLNQITGEDFIENNHIISSANKIFTSKSIANIPVGNLTVDSNKLSILDNWLVTNGINDLGIKKCIIDEIKGQIFSSLLSAHIISVEYKKLFDGIDSKINV